MLPYKNKLTPMTIDLTIEQLILPAILPPYGIKYGYILFPMLEAKDFNGKLTVFSPVGNQTISIEVVTFETYRKKSPTTVPKIKRFDSHKG